MKFPSLPHFRFGLIHVDYATQVRTLKASGHWYRDFIASSRQIP